MANGLTYKRQVNSPEAMKQLGSVLGEHLREDDVVILTGDLGAGKTQFVQGVAEGLGINCTITSPTFNILLTYPQGRLVLNHFDLYRLDDSQDLDDIGFYEVLESGGVSFIEWGDKFPNALPYSYLEVHISNLGENMRMVYTHALGEACRTLLFLWAKDSKSRLVKTTLPPFMLGN